MGPDRLVRVQSQLLSSSRLGNGAVLALSIILQTIADLGVCRKSTTTLAIELGVSVPTLYRYLNQARAAGLVAWAAPARVPGRLRYSPNQYRVAPRLLADQRRARHGISARVLARRDLGTTPKLLLSQLRGDDGATQQELAEALGVCRRHLVRLLGELRELGLVVVRRGGRYPCSYQVDPGQPAQLATRPRWQRAGAARWAPGLRLLRLRPSRRPRTAARVQRIREALLAPGRTGGPARCLR